MEKDQLSRKLAVILHADVVGSTKLVQKNEALAHKNIQTCFNRFSELIKTYSGTTREIRGDALVAEFGRASDAVIAALAFQQSNGEFDASIDDEFRPRLRIGISLGEVVIADKTITGAGIVLAQRLEQLAEPGGVVVQGSVYETVPIRLPLEFQSLGEQLLKGFDQPVKAFVANIEPGKEIPIPEKILETAIEISADKQTQLDIEDKPSIAVLPFNNMSGNPEHVYFADGISEDIITALSRFRDLLVIARNSSFIYRGESVDIRQIGRDLDVLYVLEGSVRQAGNRVRVTAQLVETSTGNHIWAERFDRSLDDIFEVQDEITALVASTVGQQVRVAETRNSLLRDQQNLRARDLIAHVQWHCDKLTEGDFAKARELCSSAIERYPRYVAAHSLLAFINIMELIYDWGDRSPEDLAHDATDAARTAITIDSDDEAAHTYLAIVYWLIGQHDAAIKECEFVIRLNPNYAFAIGVLGIVHAYSGADSYESAVQNLEKAIRLSPNDPWLQYYLAQRGTAEFYIGNYDAALEWHQKAAQRNPDFAAAHRWIAATSALKGDSERARAEMKEIVRLEPQLTIAAYTRMKKQLYKYEKDFEKYIEGLRVAGLPEK